MKIKFYMTAGHIITVDGVKDVKMRHDNITGKYIGYEITYEDYLAVKPFISLSIPDIIAVVEE